MSTFRDANTTVKGSPSKNRIKGDKNLAKQKNKPFRIKTIHKFTPTTEALSSNSRDANIKSKYIKGSPKKNWMNLLASILREALKKRKNWANLLKVEDLKGSQVDLGGKSGIKTDTR